MQSGGEGYSDEDETGPSIVPVCRFHTHSH